MLELSELLKENGNLVVCYDRAGLFSLAGRGVKNNTAHDSFEQNEHGYSFLIHTVSAVTPWLFTAIPTSQVGW